MTDILHYKRHKGITQIAPAHPMVQNWVFPDGEESEATLAHCMAVLAEKNGLDANDLQHLFPAVLRMLKNHSAWSGQAKQS